MHHFDDSCIILMHENYELDLSEGGFAELLGYEKKILTGEKNFVGARVPDITRSVDWVFLHCNLINRRANDVPSDILYIESAPINGSFSLIKSLNLKSAGKTLYEGTDIHKVIFIKNLLDFSDDFARIVAKNQFWYLDSDATTVTDGNATNAGMPARALLSHGYYPFEPILLLRRSIRQAAATNAT